jgi:ADP-L-glycero-D-manno-heptose 6-epimerase
MIVVTGGAGFIGSNLVQALNARGHDDILIIDDLQNTAKAENLAALRFTDYLDRWDFLRRLQNNPRALPAGTTIFHHGACASMTERRGKYVLKTNYEYSRELYSRTIHRCRFIYASSCAVYTFDVGLSRREEPRNLYGLSKLLFDRFIRSSPSSCQVVGLRYYAVYGPREGHKGEQASMITKGYSQLRQQGAMRLFAQCAGYDAGEHRRDFTFVGDLTKVNLWFFDRPDLSGIFDVGTGCNWSFNELAWQLIRRFGSGTIDYFDPPPEIARSYQATTQADLGALRSIGYSDSFMPLDRGLTLTLDHLQSRVSLGAAPNTTPLR